MTITKIPSPFGPLAPLVGLIRLVGVATWIGIGICVQSFVRVLHLPGRTLLPKLFHKVMTGFVLGLKVEQVGTVSTAKPTLFLSNHMSYLDILTINSLVEASFVSKSEIEDWPLFGFLAKLQDTVFVERRSVRAAEQTSDLSQHLKRGTSLILFPEGTSTDCATILPFKSSLLQMVYEEGMDDITIQPVSLACYGTGGQEAFYPWVGDMTLEPHLWNVLQQKGLTARITFHTPVKASAFKNRKELALYAHQQVESGAHGVHPL